MLTQYQLGMKNGKKDAQEGNPARSSRQWANPYRVGYSDGYWRGRGSKKTN